MHIPDGYLSPQTSLTAFAVMAPLWSWTIKRVNQIFHIKQIPLLSLCAAFSFIIMMFNIPLGFSSVHAVGAVFIAVLLGPCAACISVSVALIIQALLFGDGGILALGANCFNMAFVMPFVGYFIYKLIAGKSGINSKRSVAGIFAASYIGINAAALLTAFEFGIQPLIFKTAGGMPMYGFYPLWVSVPAMMSEHLMVVGPVEGIITVLAILYLAKFSPHLFYIRNFPDQYSRDGEGSVSTEFHPGVNSEEALIEKTSFFSRYRPFLIALSVLIVLSPLGLLATGTAWGEWGTGEIKNMIQYVPQGLEKLSQFWKSWIPDYQIPGLQNNFFELSIGYIISAVVGVAVILALVYISGKFIVRKSDRS